MLLDEPDAHLHEVAKCDLYKYIEDYTKNYNRQIILTTHSAMMTNLADSESIKMLKVDNGDVKIVNDKEKDLVSELTGGTWSAIEQNIFLTTNKALVITEGILDLKYINRAKSLFKEDYSEDFDCLACNGVDNMKNYIISLQELDMPNKKIIAILDRDQEGQRSLANI